MKNVIKVKTTVSYYYITYIPLSSVTMVLRHLTDRKRLKDGRLRCAKTQENTIILNKLDAKLPSLIKKRKRKAKPKKHSIDFSFLANDLVLREFQKDGVLFLDNKRKALLADEMGLGKTIQVLAWMGYRKEVRPFLIVCPSCAKYNWAAECKKWLNEDVYICEGRTPKPFNAGIVIINYEILAAWLPNLKRFGFKGVVADECHRLKNYKTKQSEAFRKIAAYKPYKFLLSGTPVTNRPIEFYNCLRMLDPKNFGDYWKFINTYCDPKNVGGFMNYTGSSNKTELHRLLSSTVMIRRLKVDVLPDLPPKQYSIQYLPLTNRGKYERALMKCTGDLSDIELLRQTCLELKMPAIYEWIDDFLSTGKKLILFGHHIEALELIYKKYKTKAVLYYGGTNKADRKKAVDQFQNGDTQLFLGNIKAAGEAITLTAASDVAFLELPWTPGALEQAADRAHRIGQTDTVNIWCLMAKDTIEVTMYDMIQEKRITLNHILNGEDYEEGETTILTERELWRKYRKQKVA